MSTVPDPYKVSPGDLITAQLFNGLQDKIKKDTAAEIKEAIDALHKVDQSGDSEKLGGKTPEELEEAILARALAEIPKRSGYKMIFKRLEEDKPETVNHDLKAFPLVDVYQLDYFEVICADDEEKENKFVNFYIYHSDETELKSAKTGETKRKLIIESSEEGQFVFKIKFVDMLKNLGIKFTPSQSIGDVVTEFWQELFKKPNDKFDVDQYCNSPWFEKCCGENRSMAQVEQRDNIDELWFQMRARKTINFPYGAAFNPDNTDVPMVFPNNLEVVHLDFDNIGVKLLRAPFYAPKTPTNGLPADDEINKKELKIMLLLKV